MKKDVLKVKYDCETRGVKISGRLNNCNL